MSMVESRAVTAVAVPELRVNMPDMGSTLATIVARAREKQGFTLFTVNLDHLVKLERHSGFRDAYGRADLVTADGWPIVWLARGADRRKSPRPGTVDRRVNSLQRTTGADLLEPMCREAARHGLPLYFIGPGPESQADGLAILNARYPGLQVAGAETPMIGAEPERAVVVALAKRIEESGARVCIVSLGAPKQELLADALRRLCPQVGFLCVGAALDFISGHATRAPAWVQRAGLEWFWRMVGDPRRLAGRYAQCGVALFKQCCPTLFRRTPRLVVVDQD